MGDYHVHLHPHGPYTGSGPLPGTFARDHIEAYVETALARGEEEVGFAAQVDWGVGVVLAAGQMTGAWIAARLAVTKGAAWIRWVLVAAAIVAAVRLFTT